MAAGSALGARRQPIPVAHWQTSKATVLPVFFHGHNGRLFQIASQFSQPLRLMLIIYEVTKMIAYPLNLHMDEPISYAKQLSIVVRT